MVCIERLIVFVLLFSFGRFWQKKTRVKLWLYEDTKTQLEGQIIGFDEYMNMVLDEAVEIGKKRVEVGRILVKGDSITLLLEANPPPRPQPVPEGAGMGGGGGGGDVPGGSGGGVSTPATG